MYFKFLYVKMDLIKVVLKKVHRYLRISIYVKVLVLILTDFHISI